MNAKNIEALESYFKTENDHWNGHTFRMLCEILEHNIFENPEQPLELFGNGLNYFLENSDSPLKAIQLLTNELDKEKLSESQKLFVCEQLNKYLRNTDFDNKDLTDIRQLLIQQIESLKKKLQPVKPKDIREHLQGVMQNEFEQLPETLKKLEPLQRLNVVCKLAPFVLPKVAAIHSERHERDKFPYFSFD